MLVHSSSPKSLQECFLFSCPPLDSRLSKVNTRVWVKSSWERQSPGLDSDPACHISWAENWLFYLCLWVQFFSLSSTVLWLAAAASFFESSGIFQNGARAGFYVLCEHGEGCESGGHTHKVGSVLLTVTAADCKACQSFLCLCETTGESNPLSDNSQSPRRRETFRCQVLG